jgi:hypothetical protein
MNALGQSELIAAACATKGLDPAQVTGVRLTDSDIFLQTAELGEIRVERSALPAALPAHAEQPPQPLLLRDVPANTLAALVEAGYTTLAAVAGATDEALLGVDGVGRAMLKRIRAEAPALEILPAAEAPPE